MSKNYGWVPLDKNLKSYLPNDKPYTKLEAMFSHQLDIDNNVSFSINGYAKLWQWSRCKVRLFLKVIRHPKRQLLDSQETVERQSVQLIILNIQKQKDSQETVERQSSDTPKDPTIKDKTKRKTKKEIKDIEPILPDFFDNEEFIKTLISFIQHRKDIKKPLTQHALDLTIKRLIKDSNNNSSQAIEMIENSIARGYQGVFPMERRNGKEQTSKPGRNINNREDFGNYTGKVKL